MNLEEISLSSSPKETDCYINPAYVKESNEDSLKSTKEAQSENKILDFDDLLPYVGEFGRYQKILFLLMIPFGFFLAWVYFTQFFITLIPDEYWCFIPELVNLTAGQRLNLAIPRAPDGNPEKCRMYRGNKSIDGADVSSFPVTSCESGWEYNYTEIPYPSIATELNWVCENSALRSSAQAVFFCGAIVGGLVFGWISDKFGRVPALVGTNFVGFVGGVATASCGSFWAFCVCRFLVGMAYDNCFIMMYIIVMEYVGPKWRTLVANMAIGVFFTFAATTLPWLAYYIANWKYLCYVTSVPMVLSVLIPWMVPESARWLLSQGRFEDGMKIIRNVAKINKREVPEEMYIDFQVNKYLLCLERVSPETGRFNFGFSFFGFSVFFLLVLHIFRFPIFLTFRSIIVCFRKKKTCQNILKAEEDTKSCTFLDLFKTPRLRKITILLTIMWMTMSLVFDGHVRNIDSLGLNGFLTFSIACFTELPADILLVFLLDVWGRRWLSFSTMVTGGVFCILATVVPFGVPTATLAIIGRFSVNISFNIGIQYAAELLPTVVRGQGVALVHIMGYVANILSPFIVDLNAISYSLPLLILGSVGIFGGILSLFLPETMGKDLPQTLADGENFGLDQIFCEFPCSKKLDRDSTSK